MQFKEKPVETATMNPMVTGDFEVFKPATVYAMGAIDLFAAARLPRDAQNPARPARIPPILGDFKFSADQAGFRSAKGLPTVAGVCDLDKSRRVHSAEAAIRECRRHSRR